MKKQKTLGILGIFLLLIVIFSFNVNSVGISAPYWDDNPLYVQPGETKEFTYLLQNVIGNQDVKIKAELEGDPSIIKFLDQNNLYDVPFGKNDIPVKVEIKVPQDSKPGQEWQVGVRFTTTSASTNGNQVTIGTTYSKGFKVIVNELKIVPIAQNIKKGSSSNFLIYIILALILVGVMLIIYYSRKKKENINKNE